MTEFIGVASKRSHYVKAIQAAFGETYPFNICAIHSLEDFNKKGELRFADWVSKLHCERNVDAQTLELAKRYTINYLLCPEGDEFDVEALYLEIFGTPENASKSNDKTILKLGRYQLVRKGQND